MVIDYSKGKIYKIVCNTTGLVYVGSTCKPRLCQRLAKHVSDYKSYRIGKYNFITSFKVLENNNYHIELIEKCDCKDKDELHQKERYYIQSMKCVNKVVPKRTNNEYRQDNKEKIKLYKKDYDKEYRERNKEKIKLNKKKYEILNKEKIKKNKEKYKEVINSNRTIKIICICGSEIQKCEKARHEKSKKHKLFITKNN